MAHEQASEAADGSASLYDWWLKAVPAFLGAAPAAPPPPGEGQPLPFPTPQMAEALQRTRGMLDSLYGGLLRTLAAADPGGELRSFESFVHERVSGIADQFSHLGDPASGPADMARFGSKLFATPMAALGDAMKPLSLNLERAYGGLADAFGLAPMRELEQAGRDAAEAALSRQRAQVDYLGVVADALVKAARTMNDELAEMGRRGERIETVLALARVWARVTDEAMHEALQSPRGLKSAAALLRAAPLSRQQQQRVVALASQALNMPTRAEVDDAYREIQELKRELRRLRKGQGQGQGQPPPAEAANEPVARKPARPRAPRKGARTA